MTSRSKTKGSTAERAIAKYLTEHGIPAKRQILSGSHPDHKGDIKFADGTICEVKNRESISIKMWEWLEPVSFLFLKRNGKKPLVVMTLDDFIALYNKK